MTGAGIFPSEKILKFPSEVVYLEEANEEIEPENETILLELAEDDDLDEGLDWKFDNKSKLKLPDDLTSEQKDAFTSVVKEYEDTFALSIADLKVCKVGAHVIKLKDYTPIYIPPYRIAIAENEYLKKEIKEMLDHGIIEPSDSEWSAPVIVIPKKDGTKRICIDYRKLNEVTITQQWPIPRIQDILDRIGD